MTRVFPGRHTGKALNPTRGSDPALAPAINSPHPETPSTTHSFGSAIFAGGRGPLKASVQPGGSTPRLRSFLQCFAGSWLVHNHRLCTNCSLWSGACVGRHPGQPDAHPLRRLAPADSALGARWNLRRLCKNPSRYAADVTASASGSSSRRTRSQAQRTHALATAVSAGNMGPHTFRIPRAGYGLSSATRAACVHTARARGLRSSCCAPSVGYWWPSRSSTLAVSTARSMPPASMEIPALVRAFPHPPKV